MPNSLKTQSQRRDAIKTLLLQGPAENQQAVVRALAAGGFEATQSSVSRDLRELGAIKTVAGYEFADGTSNSEGEVPRSPT
jgi:transcriptional regulator of arginine metabolism